MIGAGMLDRRLTWVQVTNTLDTYGGLVRTLTELEIWGGVEYNKSRKGEDEKDGVISLDATIVFIVRYRSSMKADDFIRYEGKDYDIVKIDEVGRHQFLRISCNTDG